GTLFHDAAQFFYQHLAAMKGSKHVLKEDIAKGLPFLQAYIDLTLWADYFRGSQYDAYSCKNAREAFLKPYLEETHSLEDFASKVSSLYSRHPAEQGKKGIGLGQIVEGVLRQYLKNLLLWDKLHCPFTLGELEKDVRQETILATPQGDVTLSIGGRIDRIDVMSDQQGEFLRVVDYKTDRPKREPDDLASLFQRVEKGQERYYLQALIYCLILREQEPRLPVRPCLFFISEAHKGGDYNPLLKLGKGKEARLITSLSDEQAAELRERLASLIAEIFNPGVPFSQAAEDSDACRYCDFRRLCQRG
ncbi:MAG: PD-(D/E)XK nuclease family protein, partial [Prevotellaceae bacterium]|nr:PD-(D/E)XK nuclease family protein [Prevotellaceae bacterium]